MAAKGGFSIGDLQKGAKQLNSVSSPSSSDSKGHKSGQDSTAIAALEDLYDKYDGDLDLIFGELKADTAKAKKPHHRPKSAKEFAQKYMEGYYSLVADASHIAEAKSHK